MLTIPNNKGFDCNRVSGTTLSPMHSRSLRYLSFTLDVVEFFLTQAVLSLGLLYCLKYFLNIWYVFSSAGITLILRWRSRID